MTSQLKQAIDIDQSLSLAEQLELLKTLSAIIQRTHSLETKATTTDEIRQIIKGFSTTSEEKDV
jgi:hypothetical protein